MAALDGYLIESTTPGMWWKVTAYKPQARRLPYVVAIEGEADAHSFTCMLGTARRKTVEIPNMRAANINAGLDQLQQHMEDAGLVVKGQSWGRVHG